MRHLSALIWVGIIFASGPAFAHIGVGIPDGLRMGFLHPLTGLDHMVAMVAVGLSGAQLGRPGIYILPLAFPAVMTLGGVAGILGILGMPVPGTELAIALSALGLGLAVTMALRAPTWAAAMGVGVFAFYHGHAHGLELPAAANPLAYSAGFVTATGMLHGMGILIGTATQWRIGTQAVRTLGAGIAGLGLVFVMSLAA